jgi:NAD dependent epimerase/dehydratase family enzyme
MKDQLFKWLDVHQLTEKEVEDFDYLEDLVHNWEEENYELEEEDLVDLILDYQVDFRLRSIS